MATPVTAPMVGKIEITVSNGEYKEFDGLMIATRIRQQAGDVQELTTVISSVSFEPIEDDTFEVPESIRKLLSPKPQ